MDQNICRICLKRSNRLKSIFDCATNFILPVFIREFCSVEIQENDDLPCSICKKCLKSLELVYETKHKCIESDRCLRELRKILNHKDAERRKLNDFAKSAEDEVLDKYIAEPNKKFIDGVKTENNSNLSSPINFENTENLVELKEEQELEQEQLPELKEDDFYGSDDEYVPDEVETSSEQSIKSRNKRITEIPEKTHLCISCGKSFFTISHLKAHEQTHESSRDWICATCGKSYKIKSYLARHVKTHVTVREFTCDSCPKAYKTVSALRHHRILVHIKNIRFYCNYCNKGFPLKIQLVSHTRSHTGEKPYQCSYCDKKYSHQIDLKRHIMLHTGNKSYKCPYCDRTFTKKSNMDCHIPTHTGAKPYKCNICFQEFRQPCPYKKHMKAHAASTANQLPDIQNQMAINQSPMELQK